MITQYLLNMLAQLLAAPLAGLPPLPAEASEVLVQLQSAGADLGQLVAKFSPIMPWVTFGSMLSIWSGLVVFWLVVLGIQAVVAAVRK